MAPLSWNPYLWPFIRSSKPPDVSAFSGGFSGQNTTAAADDGLRGEIYRLFTLA